VKTLVLAPSWLSGTDAEEPGTWSWAEDGAAFWSGSESGEAPDGAYTKWRSGQPVVDGCLLIASSGGWDAAPCDGSHPAICEGPGN
jgi:hypothetical protein